MVEGACTGISDLERILGRKYLSETKIDI